MDANLGADREHIGAVNQKLIVICKDFHFIMNTFEDQMGNDALDEFLLPELTRSMSSGRITASTGVFFPKPTSTHCQVAPSIFTRLYPLPW